MEHNGLKIVNINDNRDEVREILTNHVLECNISDIIIDMTEDMEAYEYFCYLKDMETFFTDETMTLQDLTTVTEEQMNEYKIKTQHFQYGFTLNFPAHHQFYYHELESIRDKVELIYIHIRDLFVNMTSDSIRANIDNGLLDQEIRGYYY